MWWRSKQPAKKRSFLQALFQPEVEAESPLRIAQLAPAPDQPRGISPLMSTPPSVDRLLQSPAGVPDSVTVIALSPIPDRSSYAVNSPHLGIIRERARPGGSPSRSTRTSDNASLLARLRSILSPPLESLLPGPRSVLQWPGELMPFQLAGVRRFDRRANGCSWPTIWAWARPCKLSLPCACCSCGAPSSLRCWSHPRVSWTSGGRSCSNGRPN